MSETAPTLRLAVTILHLFNLLDLSTALHSLPLFGRLRHATADPTHCLAVIIVRLVELFAGIRNRLAVLQRLNNHARALDDRRSRHCPAFKTTTLPTAFHEIAVLPTHGTYPGH